MPPSAGHRVLALALDSVVPFDLSVPSQVFGYPLPDAGEVRYAFTICSVAAGRVTTARGFAIQVPRALTALDAADTIVIPGHDDLNRPIPPRVVTALLRTAFRRGSGRAAHAVAPP